MGGIGIKGSNSSIPLIRVISPEFAPEGMKHMETVETPETVETVIELEMPESVIEPETDDSDERVNTVISLIQDAMGRIMLEHIETLTDGDRIRIIDGIARDLRMTRNLMNR